MSFVDENKYDQMFGEPVTDSHTEDILLTLMMTFTILIMIALVIA